MNIDFKQILSMLLFNILIYFVMGSPSILFWVFMPIIYLVIMTINILFIGTITRTLHFNGKKVTLIDLVKILWEYLRGKLC
jgi:hypothetical protein